MIVNKMNKAELLKALINPSVFENREQHLEAFKRFKNLRAK